MKIMKKEMIVAKNQITHTKDEKSVPFLCFFKLNERSHLYIIFRFFKR